MTRKTVVQRASLAFVAAVTASFGMTSFVSADTITTHTGPNSQNKVKPIIKNKCDIYTENNVDIQNENKQKAKSGDVSVKNDKDKEDGHDKWESESPKDASQPSSIESTDQTEEQAGAASQTAASSSDTSSEPEQTEANKSETDENWESDHDRSKIGDVKTGDAVNSNESHFSVNIETDNECPPKKAPHAHKPGQHAKPSVKPKVTPSKAAAPQVSAGAGQGAGGGQGAGFGAGVAPRVSQPQQPVAVASQPVQHQAPKPAAPCPPPKQENEHVSNNVNITTKNSVSISNTNHQYAESGSAKVSNNGHVGNVSTGDAVNENSTRASVNIETSNSSN